MWRGNPLNAVDPQGLNWIVLANRVVAGGQSLYYRYGPGIAQFINEMSGVNGALVAAAPANPLIAQIPMYASRMTPVAAGIVEAVEAGAFCSAQGTINIYRAVSPNELRNIQQTGAFSSLPGLQGKYFTTSENAAASYARQAVNGFGDPPYTIVSAKISESVLRQPGISAEVDRGIPAYVIPNGNLPGLTPYILNYSPLP